MTTPIEALLRGVDGYDDADEHVSVSMSVSEWWGVISALAHEREYCAKCRNPDLCDARGCQDRLAAAPAPRNNPPAQPAADPATVEVWNGDRKVTVYPDSVLRVWGATFDQITDEPRSLDSVQAAFDWLYERVKPAAEPTGEAIRLEGYSCAKCGCVDMVKNDASSQPADGYDKERHAQEWRALESGEAKP